MSRFSKVRLAFAAVLLAAVSLIPATRAADDNTPVKRLKQIVTLDLVLDGTPFRVTQSAGEIIKVAGSQATFGLVPKLDSEKPGEVELLVLSAQPGENINSTPAIDPLGKSKMVLGGSAQPNDEITVQGVKVSATLVSVLLTAQPSENINYQGGLDPLGKSKVVNGTSSQPWSAQPNDFLLNGTCCVTCGGITVCGCDVAASCGACNAGCGGGSGPKPAIRW